MLVQEYLKKWRIFKRVKPKNDMMYHDIYNCICQNTKNKIHNPLCQTYSPTMIKYGMKLQPLPNFNGAAVEFGELIYFIRHRTGHMITYLCTELRHASKRALDLVIYCLCRFDQMTLFKVDDEISRNRMGLWRVTIMPCDRIVLNALLSLYIHGRECGVLPRLLVLG